MWEISNRSQISSFLYAIILGVIFALLYDIFRAFRLAKSSGTINVFFQDIIYFVIISILTFIFLLSTTKGEIRAYIILGTLLGFFISKLTLSKYFVSFLNFIFKTFSKVLYTLSLRFYKMADKIYLIIKKFCRNSVKCFKKGLKKASSLLYTIRND